MVVSGYFSCTFLSVQSGATLSDFHIAMDATYFDACFSISSLLSLVGSAVVLRMYNFQPGYNHLSFLDEAEANGLHVRLEILSHVHIAAACAYICAISPRTASLKGWKMKCINSRTC